MMSTLASLRKRVSIPLASLGESKSTPYSQSLIFKRASESALDEFLYFYRSNIFITSSLWVCSSITMIGCYSYSFARVCSNEFSRDLLSAHWFMVGRPQVMHL
ncbi:hypothetical protein FGO68_gene14144 [Halteria grandinella]|uniref:Uncharacterized protein n=1 Tax=Halteria grandinella TaxID=5974 RepID=A0A8J8N9B3_HALGN|nr:hypothetical protein FGO68_gene14144 [Halteria grandinella]